MRKSLVCLMMSFVLTLSAFAKEQKPSPIEPSESFYPNLEFQNCDNDCLFTLLETGLYFNFLSRFNNDNANELLVNIYTKLLNSIIDFEKRIQKNASVKLAIIIPEQTIKSYSNTIINSSIAYLLRQRAQIKVKVFLIGTEDENKITKAFKQAQDEKFNYIIAGFTDKGVKNLLKESLDSNVKVFIPTAHKRNFDTQNENVYFGSIDYQKQIQKLLEYSNGKNIIFSDGTPLANRLDENVLNAGNGSEKIYTINSSKFDFRSILNQNRSFQDSSIILNTSLIKTALISSQIRTYDIEPFVLLSTQINYNPILLSLTQINDRKKLLLANSISNEDQTLSYLNELFSQNINYNWIAYATSVGLDYFYTQFLDKDSQRIFDESLNDNQFDYKVKIIRSQGLGFTPLQNQ
ncbi:MULTISPECIES: hypothetical protein [unclassified Campylobacter]|uniref:hypothetical protein n=1 Tax=unclassified Campylobacter TaxID=2593542 RepID=UPI00185E7658|nr:MULTISPECIES: hypothetical protein [unclassified Campylobacter]EAH6868736.1 hypothetical protein [Campylobacter lari]MCV3397256.1 hypothetical protein [Campylobacter sp. RKI_CA19_01116]MCV3471754.1 hypothetical protein [Campylobacter sp. CNRCH_2015_0338h]HEC1750665.1 hypothetical protein [Campylobacter lari]HEC1752514.1 hypothetical protein [Campylobacter lari]